MAFAAGQILLASQLNAQAGVSNVDNTVRTTTSTAWTSTLTAPTICGTSFTAPPSGKVMVNFRCSLVNSGAGNYSGMSPEIRAGTTVGSGTLFLAADDNRAISTSGTVFEEGGASILVTGLTAGSSYNAFACHRVSAGTGTYARREVVVLPTLA
ncbi:MAG: hypothetical protein ABW046_22475 [Actinoplanes sp.]